MIFPESIFLLILCIVTPEGVFSAKDQKFGCVPLLKGKYEICKFSISFIDKRLQ